MARSRAAAGSAVVEVVFQASSFIGILAHGMAVYALVILAQETVGSQSVTGSAFATSMRRWSCSRGREPP